MSEARVRVVDAEQQRLAVVRQLGMLDTVEEERFDRITRLASRTLRVPYALIGIVDSDRIWFKSRIGFPTPELPRHDSVCARAVDDADSSAEVYVVEDVATDPRFAHLSSVRGPTRVRAYGGRVLRVRGQAVGTLCVLDHHPRRFSVTDRAALIDLAYWAQDELQAADERRLAQELEALRRRSESVLAGVAEGVVGLDCDGRATFVNEAAAAMLGWDADALVGQDLHALTHSRRPDGTPYPESECPVSTVLATGESQRLLQGTFWRRDGTPVPVDWSVGAVLDADAVTGAVAVFGDATERLRTERMKDEFTAVVSHELRTPLTSVTGALDLLSNGIAGPLDPRAGHLVTLAARNAKRLARLVDDILDVEKSANGSMTLLRRRLSAPDLMRAAAETVQGAAVATGVSLVVHLPQERVVDLWGDEHRLLQVLTNLLGNALRFSPDGSTVTLHGGSDDTAVWISVSDEGIGIPADVVDRIFDRFWQVDSSSRRARGGTGLGLAIAKSIVELHDGSIGVTSTEGRGSTFTVRLPRRAQDRPVAVERRGTVTDRSTTT